MKSFYNYLFLLFPLLVLSQGIRPKGQVFKNRPEKTYENISETGLIVIRRTTYGIRFEDTRISDFYKKMVQDFLMKNPRKYPEIKTHQLTIAKRRDGYYIDGVLAQ